MKVMLTLYVTHFYKDGKLDERFLNLEKKYNYSGLAIFASQLVTEDLAVKLQILHKTELGHSCPNKCGAFEIVLDKARLEFN
jgi:hypothetical protein